ncbi:hypothetical protein NDU88_001485 [Pleurodeles waltl]|uniref:Uncharacterized protein n=1 Tax=Pleurodeles waltl TaxID=8319 RepID=A0AAV7UW75_PLEWA|nr:hypothetical protein NDU88_001485 [Pleurodeles waltl]
MAGVSDRDESQVSGCFRSSPGDGLAKASLPPPPRGHPRLDRCCCSQASNLGLGGEPRPRSFQFYAAFNYLVFFSLMNAVDTSKESVTYGEQYLNSAVDDLEVLKFHEAA